MRVTAAMSDVAIDRIVNPLGRCAGRSSSIFIVEAGPRTSAAWRRGARRNRRCTSWMLGGGVRASAASAAAAAAGVTTGSKERTMIPRSASASRTSFGAPTTSSAAPVSASASTSASTSAIVPEARRRPRLGAVAGRNDAGPADDDGEHPAVSAAELQQRRTNRPERAGRRQTAASDFGVGDRDAKSGKTRPAR